MLANTVPLWSQQLAQALAIHRMREAGAAVKQATDLTNKLLVANAETLRTGNAEARKELERGSCILSHGTIFRGLRAELFHDKHRARIRPAYETIGENLKRIAEEG